MFHVIKKILLTLLFIIFTILLNSCASSYNSLQLISDCAARYESVVKTQDCAQNSAHRLRQDGATVYASDQGLQNYWNGLVYKVKSNQISDGEAWTRFREYQVKQNARAAANAQATGEFFDGLNCIFYGVAC